MASSIDPAQTRKEFREVVNLPPAEFANRIDGEERHRRADRPASPCRVR